MKTTLLKFKYFLIAGITLVALSCNGEDGLDGLDGIDGSPGIQGEQGPPGQDGTDGQDGENGQDGADGQDGEDGEDGNANVIASAWFGPDNETQGFDGNYNFSEFDTSLENIDPSLMETATLLVYAKFDHYSPGLWPSEHAALLPITINFRTSSVHYTYYFTSSNLKIRYKIEPLIEFIFFPSTSQFRYVVIPASTTSKDTSPNFSKMSYKEVMDYLGLEH